MVTPPSDATPTVAFVDHYCWIYRSLLNKVSNFEDFKYLHLGMLSEIPPGAKKRYNSWRAYEQKLTGRKTEIRYIREIIFGKQRKTRYYQISKRNVPDPKGDESCYIMTNLEGNITLTVAPLYSLRNWIEYGFKQVKMVNLGSST